jgi:hypothetical protein
VGGGGGGLVVEGYANIAAACRHVAGLSQELESSHHRTPAVRTPALHSFAPLVRDTVL